MGEIEELVAQLFGKEMRKGCQALRILEKKSKESDQVYPHFDEFITLMRDENSYKRTRGVILIAANAKWDTEHKIEGCIDEYITHITDPKPITAKQCIKAVPKITKEKPDLKEKIELALRNADVKQYSDSMWRLVYEDIVAALKIIKKQ